MFGAFVVTLPDARPTESPAPEAAAPVVAASAVPEPPPRPVWSARGPDAPWCPPAWQPWLEAAAPGLVARHGIATGPDAHPTGLAAGETIGSRLATEGWSLLLASRRGRLHAHHGEHREDAGALRRLPGGFAAAVADGAGSAPWSRIGSALATDVVTLALQDRLAEAAGSADQLAAALQDAAASAFTAMRRFAEQADIPPKSLRCTLLVAALHAGQLGVLQVGDGAMALRRRDGTLVHPQAAATGDFSGEVAHFLPDDGSLAVLQASVAVYPADDLAGALLATDGVEDPWYPLTRHAGALFDVLTHGLRDGTSLPAGLTLAWPESVTDSTGSVEALAQWLAFEKRGENDDRTLCLIERVA